ncbi:uncharacterized protein K452DRAFT_291242 [Aplosporella prunicola CBS 121167]|uniref:Uncharacterized protein n=1 Tax=Aplosporella prunicola CBS 121167 TaxID=1176127 RepID=A0A6A6B3U7_9PEZI|nr:uncharacterized protein K452DRAFT_291242 [Aplosporella prunicola CBS 121167]KAF2137884.1 hypothetical protein K452DRAFT_291242 [Aplosporella prunicola CBS 121167]
MTGKAGEREQTFIKRRPSTANFGFRPRLKPLNPISSNSLKISKTRTRKHSILNKFQYKRTPTPKLNNHTSATPTPNNTVLPLNTNLYIYLRLLTLPFFADGCCCPRRRARSDDGGTCRGRC